MLMVVQFVTFIQDDGGRKIDMKLNVPEALKLLLVDDWEYVTKSTQVRIHASCSLSSL